MMRLEWFVVQFKVDIIFFLLLVSDSSLTLFYEFLFLDPFLKDIQTISVIGKNTLLQATKKKCFEKYRKFVIISAVVHSNRDTITNN